ncbi:MAG: hypothetical protein KC503_20925 [Myxococcales bacterium]|nr:hypothetical protein [Myxococcales bacterium]
MTTPTIAERLARIYGDARAQSVASAIDERLARFADAHPRLRAGEGPTDLLPLDAGDNLLIAYGDQFFEPDMAPLATLGRVVDETLGDLIRGIHVLPCFPYSSDDGFSVIDYHSIDSNLGSWSDVTELSRARRLMLDAVINHISSESAWFADYRAGVAPAVDYFVDDADDWDLSRVVRPRTSPLLTEVQVTRDGATHTRRVWTTFSADQIDLDYRNPDVLLAVLDVLLGYVSRGATLIRLDAVGFLYKRSGTSCLHLEQTHELVKLMRQCLDRVAPQTLLITETNVPHADNVSYFGDGSDEAQLVYNFSLPPLLLDALEHGDASVLSRWAATLELPSPRTTWFNFIASHDGIGVRPAEGLLDAARIDHLVAAVKRRGGRVGYRATPDGGKRPYELQITLFDAMAPAGEAIERSVARFRAAHAMMLALRGLPGIYAHSLFGSGSWQAGFAATGQGRTLNRQKLARDTLRGMLADPQSRASRVLAAMRALLSARRAHAAFAPAAAQRVVDLGPATFALERTAANGQTVLALADVSGRERRVVLPHAERYASLLEGGGASEQRELTLEPYGVRWLALER